VQELSGGLEWAKLIFHMVEASLWPAVAIVLAILLRRPIGKLLGRSDELSVKAPGGFELKLLASAAAVGAATARKSQGQALSRQSVNNIAVALAGSAREAHGLLNTQILWVDDVPENNSDLVEAFRILGITVDQARDTDQGLAMIATRRYSMVITDMYRPPDKEAGLTLIRKMRDANVESPVIIFAARWAAEHAGEEAKYGVRAITNDGTVVFKQTIESLLSPP
jgi:CheY-like chemotaxis protein